LSRGHTNRLRIAFYNPLKPVDRKQLVRTAGAVAGGIERDGTEAKLKQFCFERRLGGSLSGPVHSTTSCSLRIEPAEELRIETSAYRGHQSWPMTLEVFVRCRVVFGQGLVEQAGGVLLDVTEPIDIRPWSNDFLDAACICDLIPCCAHRRRCIALLSSILMLQYREWRGDD
jgi:hypothetical protein